MSKQLHNQSINQSSKPASRYRTEWLPKPSLLELVAKQQQLLVKQQEQLAEQAKQLQELKQVLQIQGPAGDKGPMSDRLPQGPAGDKGPMGEQGQQGPPGPSHEEHDQFALRVLGLVCDLQAQLADVAGA